MIASVLILVIFLVGFVLWLNRPKPPFQHVPFYTQNFEGFPSELVVERSEGEFDNDTMALASYVSDDEAFLGIKIWSLNYDIDPTHGDQWLFFHNLEVLAFTKKDDLELRELTLQSDVSVEGDSANIWFVQPYNLNLVHNDRNGDSLLVFHGVGYSNKTGFKTTSGSFEINRPSKSPLRELTFTLTLSYARGPFGLYGTSKVSTSLKVTIKQ